MRVDVEIFYKVSFKWVQRCKEHLIIPILLMNINTPKTNSMLALTQFIYVAGGLNVLSIHRTIIAHNMHMHIHIHMHI